jgi:hypothetical protein
MDGQHTAGAPLNSGSYHCQYQKKSGKCDVCRRMVESTSVLSSHFGVRHKIAGHNVHLPATQVKKHRWFIYLEECVHPEGIFQYVGSTDSMTHRWSNTKSKINALARNPQLTAGTGLEKHYQSGCSQYSDPNLTQIRITLLEHFNTSEENLLAANHQAGATNVNSLKILRTNGFADLDLSMVTLG